MSDRSGELNVSVVLERRFMRAFHFKEPRRAGGIKEPLRRDQWRQIMLTAPL